MSKHRGFTIIEALISIVTLIGVMLVLVGMVPRVYENAFHDSIHMQAATAAQQYLDSLHQYVQANGTNTGLPAAPALTVDAGDTYTGGGQTAMTSPGTFQMTNNGCPFVAGSSRMYDCKVTATWTENSQPYSLSMESYVTSEN